MTAPSAHLIHVDACLCAALDLAALALGAPVDKAAAGVLTQKGFDHVVLGLLAKLKRKVYGKEKAYLNGFIETFDDPSWHKMPKDEQSDFIAYAAKKTLGLTKDIAPSVVPILRTAGETIAARAKAESAEAAGLSLAASLDVHDRTITEHMVASSALYIRDQYGARSDVLSAKAREIVAAGIEQGFDRFQIVKRLRAELNDLNFRRSDAYYGMIVEVFAQRARTYGTLRGLEAAGIGAYEWSALNDEPTCDRCRFMDGKVFGVRAALDRYIEVAAGPPENVVAIQPWLQEGRDDAGNRFLYVKRGEEREVVAQIISSAAGQLDQKGVYAQRMSDAKMQGAGIATPPLHPHCRCLLIPSDASPPAFPRPAGIVEQSKPPAPPLPSKTPAAIPPLPDEILAQVRPPPRALGVDQETLPPDEPLSAEAASIKKALATIADLPPTKALGAYPEHLDHGLPMTAFGPTGTWLELPWEYGAVTKTKLAGAAKQKPQELAIDALTMTVPLVNKDTLVSFVKLGGPIEPIVLVKKDGKLYAQSSAYDAAQIKAAQLLGKKSIQAKIIDLDKAPKPKKPKPVPAAQPASPIAPPLDSTNILANKLAGASGSNPGGLYEGADGVKRYVKFYPDASQAHCEHAASTIYRQLGHDAPKTTLFMHEGKLAFASEIIDGGVTLKDIGLDLLSGDEAREIMRGFVADVLTGNWDAVGTGHDNVMSAPGGRFFRIDNGGTFLFRAQAGRKPDAVLDAITEWDKLLDDGVNPYYAQIAKIAGVQRPEDMRSVVAGEIKKVLDMRAGAGSWAAYLSRVVPTMDGADRARVAQMLEARTRLLEEKLRAWEKPPAKAWPGRYVEAQKSTVKPRAGLKLADLPEVDTPEHYEKLGYGEMPSKEDEDEFRARAQRAIEKASKKARDAIVEFTGSGYEQLREVEAHTDDDLSSRGYDARTIAEWRAKSDEIRKAFGVVDREPGTVYRGINNLPEDVARLFLEGEDFALGARGKPGTTSTSWKPDVAINKFMCGTSDHYEDDRYKILFVFRQKTGIPIQTISKFETEKEILLRRDARFRTTGLGRLKGTKRVLVVEAEEIDE